MGIPLTLPTNKPKDRNFVRGFCRAFIANYLAAAADPPADGAGALAYVGQIKNGGFSLGGALEWAENIGQESLQASSVHLVRHPKTMKFTLVEPVLEMLALLEGSKVTTTIAAGISSISVANITSDTHAGWKSFAGGGNYDAVDSWGLTPYRLVVERPVEGDVNQEFGLRGVIDCYKVYMRLGGDFIGDRENATELSVDSIICWDHTITPVLGAPGKMYRMVNAIYPTT